ncbi:hypothetical protein [Nocardioides sp. GXQ0305]|uniref:hypothetical protein n=1 Tax=Nocardioides sp. GXQ0305 TaxID=3423912 RepID=UPI003D7EA5E4
MLPPPRRLLLLTGGCIVLGAGVALLLTADLGSDGFSTLVNGVSLASGTSFWVANVLVSLAFLAMAAARRVVPGIGTVVQVVVVGGVASLGLDLLETPATWQGQVLLLVLSLPVLGLGITTYLGSHTGAGPAEAAGLAWDPPVPFRWSYTAVQGGGALGGWLLGATVGPGTVVVFLVLGPLVDLTSRILRLDVHQGSVARR